MAHRKLELEQLLAARNKLEGIAPRGQPTSRACAKHAQYAAPCAGRRDRGDVMKARRHHVEQRCASVTTPTRTAKSSGCNAGHGGRLINQRPFCFVFRSTTMAKAFSMDRRDAGRRGRVRGPAFSTLST